MLLEFVATANEQVGTYIFQPVMLWYCFIRTEFFLYKLCSADEHAPTPTGKYFSRLTRHYGSSLPQLLKHFHRSYFVWRNPAVNLFLLILLRHTATSMLTLAFQVRVLLDSLTHIEHKSKCRKPVATYLSPKHCSGIAYCCTLGRKSWNDRSGECCCCCISLAAQLGIGPHDQGHYFAQKLFVKQICKVR